MDPVMLVLRTFHVVAGALWVGSAFLFTGIIGPSAAEVAPTAGPLLSVAVKKRRVAKVITALAMTTVAAGWIMWLRAITSFATPGAFLGSGFGIALTVGGILATIALVIGYYGVGRNVERMVDLGDEIRAAGGPPTDAQGAEMARIGGELERHGKIDLVLLVAAIFLMATARYW